MARGASRGRHYKTKEIADALTKAYGIITAAAQILGCNQNTIHEHIKKTPSLTAVRDLARDRIVDLAEIKLFQAVDRGEQWAIREILHGPGKSRGYVTNAELTGKDGEPLDFTLKFH